MQIVKIESVSDIKKKNFHSFKEKSNILIILLKMINDDGKLPGRKFRTILLIDWLILMECQPVYSYSMPRG